MSVQPVSAWKKAWELVSLGSFIPVPDGGGVLYMGHLMMLYVDNFIITFQ